MKADAQRVSQVMGAQAQYLVPFFQRFYSWKRGDWERLWSDVTYLLGEGRNRQHFLGPLVLALVDKLPRDVMRHQIIDGQQRLTTLSLLLAAVRDVAREQGQETLAARLDEESLIHRHEQGNSRYRVVPRVGDREAFFQIIDGKWKSASTKLGVTKAYQYFRRQVTEWSAKASKPSLDDLRAAVAAQLNLVTIGIEDENPYEIFETLNFLGQPLKESDLIRNFIFMKIDQDEQQHFQEQHWQAFESLIEDAADLPQDFATQFYRNYLMRNGEYIDKTGTFIAFKEHHKRDGLEPQQLVDQLRSVAELELWLRRPETVPDKKLRWPLRRIQLLDITTAHPLLLNLLQRYRDGKLERGELTQCLDDLASFVFRRSICGESTRTYGRWFTEAIRKLGNDPSKNLQAIWHARKWPDDRTLRERLLEFPLYRREKSKARLALEELERSFGHKEVVSSEGISIEHVMPQSIGANASGNAWRKMLGGEWKEIQGRWLHSLGNLTLTGYNEDMSNKPFERKKKGFREKSNFQLNKYFSPLKKWDEGAIKKRGTELAKKLAKLFAKPESSIEYEPSTEGVTGNDEVTGGQKFRKDYWTRLNEVIKDRGSSFVRSDITDASWQEFPTPSERVRLFAKAYRNNKELRLDLVFNWNLGRTIYEHLEEQQPDIDTAFGGQLIWESWGRPFIAISREDTDVSDESAWDEQHDWLLDQLEAIQQHIFPRIQRVLDKSGVTDGDEE